MLSPIVIDCHYLQPQFAAAFLLVSQGRAAFIENNTEKATPLLLHALDEAGLAPEQVDYVIVTHVHLDHAAGSSALMQACPNATLLAHPRAVPHLVDPSKLVSSAKKVYGEESFQRFYGAIQPISSQRVREVQDGQNIPFGSSTLHFFYTRGHANHHMCIVDSASEGVFTGDSFGLAYPILQKKGLFIFPSTSPTDFDPIEACISIQKILRCGAKKAYLTHFGEISRLQEAADQLLNHLDFSQRLFHQSMNSSLEGKGLDEYCLQEERAYFEQLSTQKNLDWDSKTWDLLDLDIRLNAMGVAFSARKKRQR